MKIFYEKKPLIEWEKEMDVWLIDLFPLQHLVEYTKMDAFEKFNISNIKRHWGDFEQEFYNNYSSNIYRLADNSSSCVVIDNSKKSLIEWEKELGYWLPFISYADHLKKCSKDEALYIIDNGCFTKAWDDDADKLYMNYSTVVPIDSQDVITIRDLEYVDTVPVVINSKKQNKILKKISNIKYSFKENVIDKVIKVNCYDNKVRVRHNVFKKSMAAVLSLVTAVSAYGFSRIENFNNLFGKKISNCDFVVQNVDDFSDINIVTEKEDEKKVEEKSVCETSYDYNSKPIYNNNLQVSKNIEEIELGDVVTVKDGSYVYDNMYSAVEKNNGYDVYYSYDMYRDVNYVVLDYNDDLIFSNDLDEIDNYKINGASVVSVCTDDGFYNTEDVVKVKKYQKKI